MNVKYIFLVLAFFLVSSVYALSDPSAVYCKEMGYGLSINKTEAGENGLCKLPDGSEVDTWAFLRGFAGENYTYCVREGYKIKTINDSKKCSSVYSYSCGVCVLDDGKEIEVTKLMGLNFSEGFVIEDNTLAGEEDLQNLEGRSYAKVFIALGILIVFVLVIGIIYFARKKEKY